MKDSEFRELLNLYLDHEIKPADAARLEAEVQGNPARRRVYQDYCRMQKACKLLAQDFATDESPATPRKVVAFERASTARASRGKVLYFASGFAAVAACVALVFVNRTAPTAPSAGTSIVQATPKVVSAEPVQLVAANMDTAARSTERSGLYLRASAQAETLNLTPTVQNDPHFAWMQDVRLAPIQSQHAVEQLRFDVNPGLRPDTRTYSSPQPLSSDVYPIAIRFQR